MPASLLQEMSNLVKRTLVGIVFLAVMVFGIIWDRMIFGCLFLVILYFCLKEYYDVSLGGRFRLGSKLGILAGASAFVAVACVRFWEMSQALLLVPLGLLLLIPVANVLFGDKDNYSDVETVYGGLLYIALPISLSPFLVMDGFVFDGWMLLSLFILVWASDVGAYCIGTLLGQKPNSAKLAPEISPHKSWWGFWGGIALSLVAAFVLNRLGWFAFSVWHSLAVGLIVSAGGVCGDLFESLWKRHHHVKDSGNIIPGHGGMLDRFDSSLVAIPLACVYLAAFGLL